MFDASDSKADTGRSIASYTWSFDDGTPAASGKVVSHAYSSAGSYSAKLTITDNLGASASTSQSISVGDNLPKADFTISPTDPLVSDNVVFNAKTSSAATGRRLVSFEWDFGDARAKPNATATTTHIYNAAGTYTVVLTVTDDLGQHASTSKTLALKDIQASFTMLPTSGTHPLTVTFDASGSKVAASATITYAWSFGCGSVTCGVQPATSSTGPTTSYQYPVAGMYTVTLTIHDSNGRSSTASQTVTVN